MNFLRRKILADKYLSAACAVLVLFFLFYLWGNSLYPWRGDDFGSLYHFPEKSLFGNIADAYKNWTLRFGNIIGIFIYACGTKVVFNVLNALIQTLLILLIATSAIGRFPDLRRKHEALLLIFCAGLSVFVSRPSDTVYWVPGTVLYSWGAAVYLGFYVFLTYCEKREKVHPWIFALIAIWGFCSGYANENVALTGVLFLGARTFFKPSKLLFAALAGYIAGAVFLFTTPGALNRIASMQQGSTQLPVYNMFSKLPEIAGFYVGSCLVPLGILFILCIFYLRKCSREMLVRAGTAAGLSVFAAVVFAGCPLPPMRSYYVCSLLVMISCCALFYGAVSNAKQQKIIALAVLFSGAAVLGSSVPDFVHIYQDEALRNRSVALQKAEKVELVTVPEHRTLRRSFLHYVFIEDITEDPEFWLNRNAALYYGVPKIKSIPGKTTTPLFRDRFMKFIRGNKNE